MKLYYHIDPLGNFGDDLNAWLWPKIFPNIIDGVVGHEPSSRKNLDEAVDLVVGIGTLLNDRLPRRNKKWILGSGVGYGEPAKVDSTWNIVCVRGPLTAKALCIEEHFGIIDPAILAPDYFCSSRSIYHGEIALMPHCGSIRNHDWSIEAHAADIQIIDPGASVERVMSQISGLKFLITEALHGAIIAEAMRVPWLPVISNPGVLDLKWIDWCTTIDREYSPVRLPAIWPAKDALGRAKGKLKSIAAIRTLQRVRRRANAALAENRIIDNRKKSLMNRIDWFIANSK